MKEQSQSNSPWDGRHSLSDIDMQFQRGKETQTRRLDKTTKGASGERERRGGHRAGNEKEGKEKKKHQQTVE